MQIGNNLLESDGWNGLEQVKSFSLKNQFYDAVEKLTNCDFI